MRGWRNMAACAAAAMLAAAAPAEGNAAPGAPVPFRIAGNVYSVGAGDETAFLIVGREGMILLDGGPPASAKAVLANIEALGFDPRRIRFLLNSQAHQDHAGALAEIKARTGALMLASRADAVQLERGGHGDFAFGDSMVFAPVKVDRIVADGEIVRLGDVAITAHLTPGHTKGCTTWSLPVAEDGRILQALLVCGPTVPGYRLVGNAAYPNIVRDYEASFVKWRRLPCQIFLGAHGSYFGMERKRGLMRKGRPNPFVDPAGCRSFLARAERAFREQVRREQAERR